MDFVPFQIVYSEELVDRYYYVPNLHQTVTFENCVFENMAFGAPVDLHDDADYIKPSYLDFATLFLVTHAENTIVIRNSVFRNNRVAGKVRGCTAVF